MKTSHSSNLIALLSEQGISLTWNNEMLTTNVKKPEGLYHNTDVMLNKALELMRYKRDYNLYYHSEPSDYAMAVAEVQATQEMIDDLIIDDDFADEEAADLISTVITGYRDSLRDSYPATRKLVSRYLQELEDYRTIRFPN